MRFESLSLRQKYGNDSGYSHIFLFMGIERDSRVGAVLREQNALPYGAWLTYNLTAKDDVDNVGAGRAAKGANHFALARLIGCSCEKCPSAGVLLFTKPKRHFEALVQRTKITSP